MPTRRHRSSLSLWWVAVVLAACGPQAGGEAGVHVGASVQAGAAVGVASKPVPVQQPPSTRASAVIPVAQVETRHKGDQATVQLLARGDNAFVGKLTMAPGAEVPEHTDPTEEYIHILAGGGVFTIDGQTYDVGPGTTIYMAPGARVQFKNGPEQLVALQVFAGPGPADKYNQWTAAAAATPE